MPELPPPPPPPLSIGAALVDTLQRHRPAWLTSRAALGAAAALAIALVALVALGWSPQQEAPPEIVLPRAGTPDDPSYRTEGSVADASGKAPASTVAVHAAGAFANPGLYELPAGARVAQLVDAAGGAAPGAVLDALNLAAKLTDGERIYLPRAGEVAVDAIAGAGGAASAVGGGANGSSAGVVDLNTATLEQLDALPGVGPSTAQAILDYRQEKGRFRSVEELLEVRGIGEAKLAALRRRVKV